MGSTIKTVLDLDLSKFASKAGEAAGIVGRTIGHGLGKALERKVGAGDAFKGFVAGIGISVESIAEKVSAPWKEAAEAAEKILESTKDTLAIYGRIFEGRRTNQQNIDQLDKDRARLLKELETTKGSVQSHVERRRDVVNHTDFDRTVVDKITPANPVRAAEIAKELAENAAKREEYVKKDREEEKKNSDEKEKNEKELGDLREKNAREQLSTDEQIADLEKKRNDLRATEEVRSLVEGAANIQNLIEAEKIEADILALKKQQTDEAERLREKQEEAMRQHGTEVQHLKEELAGAKKTVAETVQDIANARHDAVAFTVGDAAAGRRGSPTDRAKARQIASLEKRAQRAYDSGNTFRGPDGKPISSEEYAQGLMGRARDLRGGFNRASTADQNPEKTMTKQLETANEHLKKIENSLASVETD